MYNINYTLNIFIAFKNDNGIFQNKHKTKTCILAIIYLFYFLSCELLLLGIFGSNELQLLQYLGERGICNKSRLCSALLESIILYCSNINYSGLW